MNYKLSQYIHDWNQQIDNSLIEIELNYDLTIEQYGYDQKYI